MTSRLPTLLIFGMPKDPSIFSKLSHDMGLGITIDNGLARDPVFSFYENISRADAVLAFPNAHPVHLTSLIAEGEVGHPLLVQETVQKTNQARNFPLKPIIFFGTASDWSPFKETFEIMRTQGLIREGFDRVVTYCSSIQESLACLSARLPSRVRSTRIDYYLHVQKAADLSFEYKKDTHPTSEITLSFFGSATTRNPQHLKRVHEAARACARNEWNILHGGGDAGVMGELSTAGKKYGAYVFGVSVDFSGAPKIYFEKDNDADKLEELDYYVSSKDMLHRIETYAGYSEAFVALDGGIGSIQEILVIAELLSTNHPAVTYVTKTNHIARKPLYVVNQSNIYSPLKELLHSQQFTYLTDHIREVDTVAEVEIATQEHLRAYPPKSQSLNEKVLFRNNYTTQELPDNDLIRSLPSILESQSPIESR